MALCKPANGTHVVLTGPPWGDLARSVPTEVLHQRQQAIAPCRWTVLDQVHGADVVVVEQPGDHVGASADAAVTDRPDAVLCALTADCAGVAFYSEEGVLGVAHAGWRGLAAGVIQACVEVMRDCGARRIGWQLNACISAGANEFSPPELESLVERLGPGVRSVTLDGRPAFDLRAGVGVALAEAGLEVPAGSLRVPCTVLDGEWYSWRARRDTGRQATVVWRRSVVAP
ncbi:MAG: laccase domain-containing protein [Actinomycetota bacterium]